MSGIQEHLIAGWFLQRVSGSFCQYAGQDLSHLKAWRVLEYGISFSMPSPLLELKENSSFCIDQNFSFQYKPNNCLQRRPWVLLICSVDSCRESSLFMGNALFWFSLPSFRELFPSPRSFLCSCEVSCVPLYGRSMNECWLPWLTP